MPAPVTSHHDFEREPRPHVISWVLLVGLFVVVAFVPDEAVLRQKAVWAKVALFAAAAVSLFETARAGWRPRVGAPLMAGLVGVTAVAGAHLALSDLSSARLGWDELTRLALYPLGAWAAAAVLVDRRSSDRLGLAVCLVAIPVAAYAVGQHLADVLSLPIDRHQRAPSTFGNPVFLGAFLVLVLPWCLATAAFAPTRTRWVAAIATGLGLPALFATGSVGSWVAFGGAVAIGVLVAVPSRRLQLQVLGAGLVAAVVIGVVGGDQIARQRAHTLIWRDTWTMVADHPFGIGPGQFHVEFTEYASPELLGVYPPGRHVINDVHSEPLQVLVELGWIGLAFAALALGALAVRGYTTVARSQDVWRRAQAAAVFAGLAGTVLLSLTSPDQRFTVSVTTTAVFVGWLVALDPAAVSSGRRLTTSGRAVAVLLGVCALGAAFWTADTRTRRSDLVLPHQVAAADAKARVAPLELRQLEIARRARPRSADDQRDLATLLLQHGHFADAADAYRRTVAMGLDTPEVQRALGVAECSAGRFADAREPLGLALDAWPDDPDLRFTVAYVAWRVGDLPNAVRHAEEALARDPDHAYARLLMQTLRE